MDPLREDPHERMILGIREVLRPNVGQLHGIRSVAAFESTTPRTLQRFFLAALRSGLPATRALALLGAEVFLATSSSPYTRLPDVLLLGGALNGRRAILKNLACPPWAYVTAEARGARLRAHRRLYGWRGYPSRRCHRAAMQGPRPAAPKRETGRHC